MNITIVNAEKCHMADCVEALRNSRLGEEYFSEAGKAEKALAEALESRQLHVALAEDGTCAGFIYYAPTGVFMHFPYLHIIAVKKEYRGMGVGKQLLQYVADRAMEGSRKTFLTVDDFNPDARRLYEAVGYQEVGPIPNLYKKGRTSYLMMRCV